MNDPFDDPENFRWARPIPPRQMERSAPTATLPRPRKGEPYIGGPIPLSWAAVAVRLPGKAWTVGCAL
jgi:hypothetical protein